MRRLLSPLTNPAGLSSAAAAIYAAAVMIVHATRGQGIIDMPVIVAAVAAADALYTRQKVTPVADPRDGNGTPLKTAGTLTVTVPPDPHYAAPPPSRGMHADPRQVPADLKEPAMQPGQPPDGPAA